MMCRITPLIMSALLVATLSACSGDDGAQNTQAQKSEAPPRPMPVMTIQKKDIPLNRTYASKLRSDEEVTLVSRVVGTLEARHFEPGDIVAKGQLLYSIEPDRYQATVHEREADIESAKAELYRAQRDAERFKRLLSQNSVSRQDYDQAEADRRTAAAKVSQAEAALASAQLDLEYASVTAPVGGRISLSEVNLGNLVNSGDELATITPLNPLEVRFQLPQKDAFELRHQLGNDQAVSEIKTRLNSRDSQRHLDGHLKFLGSRVNEGTSTVQASAIFDNPEATFLPGQFVRVSVQNLKRFNVIAVPEDAITQGLMGPQVYVLDDENKARARTVQLGDLAGHQQIIVEGLKEGDRVLAGDIAAIEPGTTIEPQAYTPKSDTSKAESQDSSAQPNKAKQAGDA
ncbi:efflux transporter periplasmic adaptor subunit [Terasakiispira papahanaumokuakeensis]|uniref:Efflux transporter periplasmic adaptor subunit n=1 Tax=Terasakiispira papahanaumokuakeensis TaxID=197479 RepID=A0A1E2VCX7_9GAMM|nr:efflux RND transporter periplasmic adaptor subunit [Terasakiispira papahanaumokuakeensis]ODC04870.1 efflux transporter periplasmic adaptor subunit [Terasakiispira papahanaumokuakeensis]